MEYNKADPLDEGTVGQKVYGTVDLLGNGTFDQLKEGHILCKYHLKVGTMDKKDGTVLLRIFVQISWKEVPRLSLRNVPTRSGSTEGRHGAGGMYRIWIN